MISVEIIILDFRYFLDEALNFIEFYEYGERDLTRKFHTNRKEICQLRQFAIEYIRLVYDIKKLFKEHNRIAEFNLGFKFSEQFKNKRIFFFTTLFKRLDKLYGRLYSENVTSKELVKLYFKTIQKLVRNTNELVGYLESNRWRKDIALQILDKLVEQCNDFLCIFEKV